ncbi:MAG: glycosyltransferase [Phycisphaerales bacterium]|nr:glycosyltransferase [Phycisphaerales bacterium]
MSGAAVESEAPSTSRDAPVDVRAYDGVICFGGEDWWYHNRGHYDMQMMRECSASLPVLYVNSIGMRVPSAREGRMFVQRVRRKLKSLRRGMVRVRDRFAVFSPAVAPAGLGGKFNDTLLAWQVRRAAKKLGIKRPLVWVACPPGAKVVDRLNAVGVVYQRTDRFEAFANVDTERIAGFDRFLKDRADLTLFCSSWLHAEEAGGCRRALFVDHGVDSTDFEKAGRGDAPEPEDVRDIPRPRVGFIGGIDSHTFDPELFVAAASKLPEVNFFLVGACSLPEGWCELSNVKLLGKRDYEQVPAYMAAADVLIMPWNQSDWIRACNPVKLKEYLAVGRPVVSTPFPELERYEGLVRVGADADAFAAQISEAIEQRHDPAPGRDRVRPQTWTEKWRSVQRALAELGLEANG